MDNDKTDIITVTNNLLECQLQACTEELEDFAILENVVFANHERAFIGLEKRTSNNIYRALEQVSDGESLEKIAIHHPNDRTLTSLHLIDCFHRQNGKFNAPIATKFSQIKTLRCMFACMMKTISLFRLSK